MHVPLEDCGGSDGYKYLWKELKNPKDEEHQDMKEWMDDMGYKKFNPTKFKVCCYWRLNVFLVYHLIVHKHNTFPFAENITKNDFVSHIVTKNQGSFRFDFTFETPHSMLITILRE